MIIYRAIKHWKKAVFYSKLPCALYNIIFKYLKNYRMNLEIRNLCRTLLKFTKINKNVLEITKRQEKKRNHFVQSRLMHIHLLIFER